MKLTVSKRNWIDKKVNTYCNSLEIKPPLLLLTRKEYEDWKRKKREALAKNINNVHTGYSKGVRVGRSVSRVFGVCHLGDNMVFLNVKKSSRLRDLDNTIRHELIHYSKPSYNHRSSAFFDGMKRLERGKIRNGRFTKRKPIQEASKVQTINNYSY